jgi:hypothetical protein
MLKPFLLTNFPKPGSGSGLKSIFLAECEDDKGLHQQLRGHIYAKKDWPERFNQPPAHWVSVYFLSLLFALPEAQR